MPGESALFRAPVVIEEFLIFANNEEAKVLTIEKSTLSHDIEEAPDAPKWTATIPRIRWKHLHEFQQSFAKLQSVYSLTAHTSQGGTFGSVFVDLPDIRRREQ